MNTTLNIEELEHQLIQITQSGIPIVERPFAEIAEKMGISEQQVISMMDSMKRNGVIRRIGLVPNHYALGYLFNLMTVWDIQDDEINNVGDMVGNLDYVSHCYQRPRHLPDWPYNFFAMVHGTTELEVQQKMNSIEELVKDHCKQHIALKSTKILKKTGIRI